MSGELTRIFMTIDSIGGAQTRNVAEAKLMFYIVRAFSDKYNILMK